MSSTPVARFGADSSQDFHSTRRNDGAPLVPLFAAMLKVRSSRLGFFVGAYVTLIASTSIELTRTASRVALSREQNSLEEYQNGDPYRPVLRDYHCEWNGPL